MRVMTLRQIPAGSVTWHTYYNRLHAAGGRVTKAIKDHALAAANGRCTICKTKWRNVKMPPHRKTPWDFHHKRPLIKGGRTTKRNIQAVCLWCNYRAQRG